MTAQQPNAHEDEDEVVLDKRGLPPISRIKMPEGIKVTSTRIRWLSAVGYQPREIAPYLGCRYQQVRNVLQNPPKRAAREDLPPLVVKVLELSKDMLEIADEEHLRQQMAAQRQEHRAERKAVNKKRRQILAAQNELGNEELDHEDYVEE